MDIKILGNLLREHDQSGKLERTSWGVVRRVTPHRGGPLLGGSAHSVWYGEMIHDGLGKT